MHTDSKTRSLTFLSLLCFALADVRDGLGPFFGVFLQGKGWLPDEIGYVMTAGGLAGMFCTTPLGALVDRADKKRLLLGATVIMIVVACGGIFLWFNTFSVWTSRILHGALAAAIAPTLSGITLGMVGQKGLPARLGKNEAWNHFGNGATAVLGTVVGYYYGIPGVFFVMAVMGVLCIICLGGINPAHIDNATARGLEENQGKPDAAPIPLRALFSDRALLAIAITLAFFHLGNAAMLPLLGQSAVARFDVNPAAYTGVTVIIAQVTMIATALLGSWIALRRGYGMLFLIALLALPVRGLVAGFYDSPWSVVPVQILDGISSGLMGVATPGIVARILRGSGHVNLGLGFVLTIQGLGAAFSTTYGGLFAHYISYSAAFLALAVAPCMGLTVFALASRRYRSLADAATAFN